METIEFRELIEMFLVSVIGWIKRDKDVPKMNFNFNEEGIKLLKEVVNNPFADTGYRATMKDVNNVIDQDKDVITIKIDDANRFFELLKDITNATVKLEKNYGNKSIARNVALGLMRQIWLRMGIEDVNNIKRFLEKQLEFVNDMTFDTQSDKKVSSFYDGDVLMHTEVNRLWDESTRSMHFTIKEDDKAYSLPRVLYDIDSEGKCYIYAIQKSKSEESDKSIERKLYKINKGIENPNVHPSKVYSMMLFINELKKKGISRIVIPSMQVLNYHYHELLGNTIKDDYDRVKDRLEKYPNEENTILDFNYIKKWYDNVANKEDKISYLKTEELIYIMYRMLEHDNSIEITNDVNIQGDSLNANIR